MESLNQKILNKKKVYESTRKGEIKLAQMPIIQVTEKV